LPNSVFSVQLKIILKEVSNILKNGIFSWLAAWPMDQLIYWHCLIEGLAEEPTANAIIWSVQYCFIPPGAFCIVQYNITHSCSHFVMFAIENVLIYSGFPVAHYCTMFITETIHIFCCKQRYFLYCYLFITLCSTLSQSEVSWPFHLLAFDGWGNCSHTNIRTVSSVWSGHNYTVKNMGDILSR